MPILLNRTNYNDWKRKNKDAPLSRRWVEICEVVLFTAYRSYGPGITKLKFSFQTLRAMRFPSR